MAIPPVIFSRCLICLEGGVFREDDIDRGNHREEMIRWGRFSSLFVHRECLELVGKITAYLDDKLENFIDPSEGNRARNEGHILAVAAIRGQCAREGGGTIRNYVEEYGEERLFTLCQRVGQHAIGEYARGISRREYNRYLA